MSNNPMENEETRINSFNVVAAGSAIVALGSLGYLIVEPSLLSLSLTALSTTVYGVARQMGVYCDTNGYTGTNEHDL